MLGDCYDRSYDPEELEEWEAWVLPLFEPLRQRFFVAPFCGEQDIPFFIPSFVASDSPCMCLAGMHPKLPGRVWKEIVLLRYWGVIHVYSISGHAQQLYRTLEYTSNCKLCYSAMQPNVSDRQQPLPAWAQHEAGSINIQPETDHDGCLAISRNHILAPQDFFC
jgi:hypothetical protein